MSSSVSTWIYRQPAWLILAVASGACAAINGVFAKLTTTALTTSWSHAAAGFLNLSPENVVVNFALRGMFFGLNIAFNILMWTLFTAALTRASSTTRVSIINTSANFMVTAFLGAAIFSEKLGGRWWIGAALLAVGNVIIGRRDEGVKTVVAAGGSTGGAGDGLGLARASVDGERTQEEQENLLLGDDEEEVANIIDVGDEDLLGKQDSKEGGN